MCCCLVDSLPLLSRVVCHRGFLNCVLIPCVSLSSEHSPAAAEGKFRRAARAEAERRRLERRDAAQPQAGWDSRQRRRQQRRLGWTERPRCEGPGGACLFARMCFRPLVVLRWSWSLEDLTMCFAGVRTVPSTCVRDHFLFGGTLRVRIVGDKRERERRATWRHEEPTAAVSDRRSAEGSKRGGQPASPELLTASVGSSKLADGRRVSTKGDGGGQASDGGSEPQHRLRFPFYRITARSSSSPSPPASYCSSPPLLPPLLLPFTLPYARTLSN